MDCQNCEHNNDKTPVTVPLFAVEGQNYRANKTSRHLATVFCVSLVIIALIIGLFGVIVYRMNQECLAKVESINRYWLEFFAEFDIDGDITDYNQDGRGINIIGDGNGVNGYESEVSDTESDIQEEDWQE